MGDRLRLRLCLESAHHQIDTSGTSWLSLLLHQNPQHYTGHYSLPGMVARRPLGQGPAAQITASSLVRHLRRGDHVMVWADAIGVCPRTGHFMLHGCTHVERLDAPGETATQPERQAA